MIVAKFNGPGIATADGLTQWDYGQELAIEFAGTEIPDGTEVDFYQGALSGAGYIKSKHILIPDLMLQNAEQITAYVYVRAGGSGETILAVKMPVQARPRPENYILPEYTEYKRLLPDGGDEGQALVKKSAVDYDTGWSDAGASGIEEMTDEEVDALFRENSMSN